MEDSKSSRGGGERSPSAAASPPHRSTAAREVWGFSCILSAGLLARLVLVWVFPTRPVSDFQGLVEFGLWMRDHSVTTGGYFWDLFNPGLPLILSQLLRIFPGTAEGTARLSTAVATGFMPVLPFVLWRGVQPFWVRCLAGGMLALWPGQVAFSGVVAQDNWVLLPTLALAALAVRCLAERRGRPVAAGLLYAFAVSIRQEMLVACLPLLVAGAGLGSGERRRRSLLLCSLAVGIPFLLLALQRQTATGRFALSSPHLGPSLLGSYVPGATANAWADPMPYIASVEPSLLEDPRELRRGAVRLAWRAACERAAFHAARISAFALSFAVTSEAANLVWSLTPEVLPPWCHARVLVFTRYFSPFLRFEMAALLALFLASLLLAPRNQAIWLLSAAVAVKIGLHVVTVSQGRFFLAATALQILVIALGAREAVSHAHWRSVALAFLSGGAAAALVLNLAPRAVAWVQAHDTDHPRTYRFSLSLFPGDPRSIDCKVDRGRLIGISPTGAMIETFQPQPSPGETASVECVSRNSVSPSPLVIRLLDPYAPGGQPGRMVQRLIVDGRVVLVHDVAAESGSGWYERPLGEIGRGKKIAIRIELVALRPDPGISWGKQAATSFEFARVAEKR